MNLFVVEQFAKNLCFRLNVGEVFAGKLNLNIVRVEVENALVFVDFENQLQNLSFRTRK